MERTFAIYSGVIAMICQYSFCIAYGWDVSFWSAILLYGCGIVGAQLYVIVSTIILGGDNPLVWRLSTVALYPMIYMLATKLTWFGFFAGNGFATT